MIRRLIEVDRECLVEYLMIEETLNIYALDSIKVLGFENDLLKIYGELDELNHYLSVVLLFRETSVLFYSHNSLFSNDWVEMFDNYDLTYLSCGERFREAITPHFKGYDVLTYYIAEASEMIEERTGTDYEILEMTTEEEFEKLFYLLKPFHEFEGRTRNLQDFLERRMNNLEFGSSYYIDENDVIISSASFYRHIENTGIVGMVATVVEERNRGLATILMKHLMHQHIKVEQKTLCLFYDNPKAGSMYKRLGFRDVYNWTVLVKK